MRHLGQQDLKAAELLPQIRDLYSRHPEMLTLEPWHLAWVLFALGYTDETGARLARGRVYVMRHYHVCGDEAPGADCSGGCFSGAAA